MVGREISKDEKRLPTLPIRDQLRRPVIKETVRVHLDIGTHLILVDEMIDAKAKLEAPRAQEVAHRGVE